MVHEAIVRHLETAGVPVVVRPHERVVAAQRLAASVHVSGHRVAKSVLVDIDGRPTIAVLPAAEIVDPGRLAAALGAQYARIMDEGEFIDLFPGCELGAEPPFGSLYGLPVVMDGSLARSRGPLVLRAGSHEEVLEMETDDFFRLERPRLADFAVLPASISRYQEEGRWI